MTKSLTSGAAQPPAQPRNPPACPVCGALAWSDACASDDGGFSVLRCPACGLGRTWPAMAPGEITRWYPESYYGKENIRFNRLFEALTRVLRRRRARILQKRVPRGPVLDVGCGRGIMLDHLRRLGYQAHGCELSDTAAWHARHLGLDVTTGDFLSSPHASGRFNAVIFWHVLEHFISPLEALARARELLRPGGLAVVAVPNFDSLQARLFGRHWFHLDLPRHYFHFGTRSMAAVLQRQGLRIIRCDHFCLEQNPFGWLQSFYNALGFPKNLLYDMLRAPSARTGTARAHPLACALTAALLPLLLPLCLLLTILDAALRQGGTIEVYATKP